MTWLTLLLLGPHTVATTSLVWSHIWLAQGPRSGCKRAGKQEGGGVSAWISDSHSKILTGCGCMTGFRLPHQGLLVPHTKLRPACCPSSMEPRLWQGPHWQLCNPAQPQMSSGTSSTIVGLLVNRNCFPATIVLWMKSFPDTRHPWRASSAPHPGLVGSAFLLPVGYKSLIKWQHNKTK